MNDSPKTTVPPLDRKELLRLLDHVDGLVRWCSANMPDKNRFHKGANAMWAVAHSLAGNNDAAAILVQKHRLLEEPAL